MYQMYTTTHVHDLVEIEDDFCFSKTENLEQPSTKITSVCGLRTSEHNCAFRQTNYFLNKVLRKSKTLIPESVTSYGIILGKLFPFPLL